MLIVVDAYNMLRQFIWTPEISQQERNAFVSHLGQYAKKKGHDITVVFDGGPYQWPSDEKHKGITVIYAGARTTADDCITEYLSEHSGRELLLVSSDRELNEWASDHDVYSISSGHFWRILKDENIVDHSRGKRTKASKFSKEKNSDLDMLMEQSVSHKNEEVQESRTSKSKTLSKQERKKQAILKKL